MVRKKLMLVTNVFFYRRSKTWIIFEHHKYEIYTIICKIHEHRDLDTCGKRKIVCFNRNSRQLFPLSPNYISQNIRQFITWNKNCWKKCFVDSAFTLTFITTVSYRKLGYFGIMIFWRFCQNVEAQSHMQCRKSISALLYTIFTYTVNPAHVITCIKSNLLMWSPLLSQTCSCVTFIRWPHEQVWLNRGDHMSRFDLIQVITWAGLTVYVKIV
jgi:hypothetical protein